MFKKNSLLLIVLVATALLACRESSRTEAADTSSNWLKTCNSSKACGDELSCICGLCTVGCRRQSDCDKYDAKATCISAQQAALKESCQSDSVDDSTRICMSASESEDSGDSEDPGDAGDVGNSNGGLGGIQDNTASGSDSRVSANDASASNSSGPITLCEELVDQAECTPESYRVQEPSARILFVVDRSASMSCNTPADGQSTEECEITAATKDPNLPTKWDITTDALQQLFKELNDSGISAGLMFFSIDDLCGVSTDFLYSGVPIDLLDEAHFATLRNALESTTPRGGSPLVSAIVSAYDYLRQETIDDCGSSSCGAYGNRFVILITDGSDTCPEPIDFSCGSDTIPCTDYLLDTEVPPASDEAIRTFVVGAPGSELARGFLSELAFLGGTPKNGGQCIHDDRNGQSGDCHFDMTQTQDFGKDLAQALVKISDSTLGCEFNIPDIDIDPEYVNLQYRLDSDDPICLPRDDSKSCVAGADGWQFAVDASGHRDTNRIVLCGSVCDTIKSNPSVQVDVILQCPYAL